MKYNAQWKTLSRDQKAAWRQWARNNTVLLDNGVRRHVCALKAFSRILSNRALAGEAANPTVVPATVTWLTNALSTSDAGPFTTNLGYVGFRAGQTFVAATKWFVWATAPLLASETQPDRWLRFVKCLSLGALNAGDLVPSFATDYRAVLGSFDGPGEEGAWPEDHFVWFRLHQYAHGQLGSGQMLKGRIEVEL
jgi:hypothetical protein